MKLKKNGVPGLSLDLKCLCLISNKGNTRTLIFTTVTLSHWEGCVGDIKTELCSACSQDCSQTHLGIKKCR